MDDLRVFHERQEAALCGQHCLNNLLQGQYYSATDLADIAQELDQIESSILGGPQSSSSNVDDSGNFSLHVLYEALKRSHGLTLEANRSAVSEALRTSIKDDGVICNLENHWIAIRRVHGVWFNLDSLKKRPEKISDFYLNAYLSQLQQDGWHIFLVKGALPYPLPPETGHRNVSWYPLSLFMGEGGRSKAPNEQKEEQELAEALSLSMQGNQKQDQDELEMALAYSLAENRGQEEDEELQRALALSAEVGAERHAETHSESKADPKRARVIDISTSWVCDGQDDCMWALHARIQADVLAPYLPSEPRGTAIQVKLQPAVGVPLQPSVHSFEAEAPTQALYAWVYALLGESAKNGPSATTLSLQQVAKELGTVKLSIPGPAGATLPSLDTSVEQPTTLKDESLTGNTLVRVELMKQTMHESGNVALDVTGLVVQALMCIKKQEIV